MDYYLYNINPKWMSLYLNYYSHADRGMYGIAQRDLEHLDDVYVHKWKFEKSTEVIPDYIRPRNLVSSLGFSLHDEAGNVRTVIAFDRLTSMPFSEEEIELIRAVRKLLNPYHRLLFGVSAKTDREKVETQLLTARENEVLNLLRQGLAPANIAHILHITIPTTKRHISNIYKKLKVNSRGELMAKINQNY
jgi:DNA-binding NarL/FixJ family response regulator